MGMLDGRKPVCLASARECGQAALGFIAGVYSDSFCQLPFQGSPDQASMEAVPDRL